MKLIRIYWSILCFCVSVFSLPVSLLYDYNDEEAVHLPKEDDTSSQEIKLKVPIIFYGVPYELIFVNSNGLLSFQTEIPNFFNIEFPLDYPLIAPFYSNVDIRKSGTITYYETESPSLLQRATENVHDSFLDAGDFQAASIFVVTWKDVGYYKEGSDKVNTYQVVISTDGASSFVEFLYPENGIQWIQGTGDESGLPDARAQAGFISADGKVFTLPGSGTEQVRNLEKWSNMNLEGQFIYRIDESDILEPDLNNEDKASNADPVTCAEAPTYCHAQATCIDHTEGFCCSCKKQYYGNGKSCIKKDVPLRVNGRVNGKINEEKIENLDLQSYIVMTDGRAYTAMSKIPESIGYDIQSLQILGGVIGYVFAKPVRNAQNGYQLTGGVFNHSAKINFVNTSQTIHIKQKYLGLDLFDQLRLETNIQGEIPTIPDDAKVEIDEYQEHYTMTSPGVIQSTSSRTLRYKTLDDQEFTHLYNVEQAYVFDYCKYENTSVGETWKLKVGRNFISYETQEQIIRFGLSNKVTPSADVDPCDEGRTKCGENSVCVVENDSFRCICTPGFQHYYTGNETICADVNECQAGLQDCNFNAECINTIGSYLCKCNPGYEGNGRICENARSCENVSCNENAECTEDNQVAVCRCLPGFTGDGQRCDPLVDRSCHTVNNCSPQGYCTINPETNLYSCYCLPGYEGDGYICREVPATTTELDQSCYTLKNCSPYGLCTLNSLLQVYECLCQDGYEGDGYVCEKVNSTEAPISRVIQRCLLAVCWCPEGYKIEEGTSYCLLDEETTISPPVTENADSCQVLNNCHKDAKCIHNSVTDSYYCSCNSGFEGDGYSCVEELVSCNVADNCDPHATCTYDETIGKSKCICSAGYEGDGYSCKISVSDICSSQNDCMETEECRLITDQHYECVCKEGYQRDSQHQCVISGSCGGGACVENAECLFDDEYQSYYCACKDGFMGDGITECKPKPIECNEVNNCGEHAACEYDTSTSSFQCKCNEGFYGDGLTCYTEKTCHNDPYLCDRHATCITTNERSYVCQCNTGFIGNGTLCKEVQKHEGNFLLVNQGMATLKIPIDENRKSFGKPIQLKYDQTAVGLDIDCLEGRVYWGDISGRTIRSSLFNGSDKADFIKYGIGSPEGLAVDWISRNIYWTDSTKDTIEVANLDSKRRRTLFSTNLVNPRGIAVHPQRGKIFWTDWDRRSPKIEWANADGTNRQIFLQGEAVSLPNSLTIDYDTEQLCYADAGTKKIECVYIDSREKQTIALNCTYPFGIAVTDQQVYWSDWIMKKIERVDKQTLKRLPPLNVPLGGSGNKLFGLVAVPISCPPLTNVCQYYKDQCPAEHICLPNGSGSRSCVCTYQSDNPEQAPSCVL